MLCQCSLLKVIPGVSYFYMTEFEMIHVSHIKIKCTLFKFASIFIHLFTKNTDLLFPQQREVKLLNVPWDSYVKKTTRSAKFSGKNSRIFILKDDKIVYNYFFGKFYLTTGSLDQCCLQKTSLARHLDVL